MNVKYKMGVEHSSSSSSSSECEYTRKQKIMVKSCKHKESEKDNESFSSIESTEEQEIKIKSCKHETPEKSIDDSLFCNVCMCKKKEYAFVPCYHLCLCRDCYDKCKNRKVCVICGQKATNIVKIYI